VDPSSVEMDDRLAEESSVHEKVAVSVLLVLVRATPLASAEARESSLKSGRKHLGMTTIAVFFGGSELVKSSTWTGLLGLLLVVYSKAEHVEMGDMVIAAEVDSSANIIDI